LLRKPRVATEKPTGEPIKIGFFAPITGPAAADGESADRSAKLAVKIINEQGGVLGRPIELVTYDDAFSPDEAANVVRRMIEQDKVVAVVSGSYSFTTRAGAPIAQEAGVPFIAAYAVHPLVTETGEYVWRIGALAPIQGRAGAQLVFDKLNARKVAILVVDNDFGISLTDGFKSHAAELGMEIVYEQKYPLGESDFRPMLDGIKAAKPDVIYATGYYAEAASLVSQMKEAGINIQVVGQEGYDSPTFLQLAGEAANGVIFTTDLNRDSKRAPVQQFLKSFEDAYGAQADAVGASVYDAVQVMAAGIEAGGSTEPAAILQGLKSLKNFDLAVTGPIIRFTEGREVVRPIGAQIVQDNAFHFYAEIDDPKLITPDK
jgi:branched-chain amino acid transport system substrate-binding protein